MNWGTTVKELMPFDLMMDLFVSATARCALNRSSSVEEAVGVGFGGTEVRLVDGGELSDITSSSASSGGRGGRCVGGGGSVSSSISIGGEGGLGEGSGLGGSGVEMWGMGALGVGDGVDGVDAISGEESPSSTRTLGGKNCEPER